MVIKSVQLETVCGITSKLPDNMLPERFFIIWKQSFHMIKSYSCIPRFCVRLQLF